MPAEIIAQFHVFTSRTGGSISQRKCGIFVVVLCDRKLIRLLAKEMWHFCCGSVR